MITLSITLIHGQSAIKNLCHFKKIGNQNLQINYCTSGLHKIRFKDSIRHLLDEFTKHKKDIDILFSMRNTIEKKPINIFFIEMNSTPSLKEQNLLGKAVNNQNNPYILLDNDLLNHDNKAFGYKINQKKYVKFIDTPIQTYIEKFTHEYFHLKQLELIPIQNQQFALEAFSIWYEAITFKNQFQREYYLNKFSMHPNTPLFTTWHQLDYAIGYFIVDLPNSKKIFQDFFTHKIQEPTQKDSKILATVFLKNGLNLGKTLGKFLNATINPSSIKKIPIPESISPYAIIKTEGDFISEKCLIPLHKKTICIKSIRAKNEIWYNPHNDFVNLHH